MHLVVCDAFNGLAPKHLSDILTTYNPIRSPGLSFSTEHRIRSRTSQGVLVALLFGTNWLLV